MYLYIGSIGSKNGVKGSLSGHGEGIYTIEWNETSIQHIDTTHSNNAGIICLSHDKRYLYCANEVKDFTGLNGSGGGITAYKIVDNKLFKLNESISYGSRPAYVSITDDDQYLLVANHGSHTTVTCHYVLNKNGEYELQRGFDDSSVAVFRINDDGSIGNLCDLKVFDGHGYWCHGGGQSTSHIHCVKSKGDLVIACNRGCDSIEVMKLDKQTGKLSIIERYHTPSAYAPRHFVFHPRKDIIYVVNENYPVVSIYEIKDDHLQALQHIGCMNDTYYIEYPLPSYTKKEADINEVNSSGMADMSKVMPSDIHINNSYVYVSNRCLKGKGSLATFHIQEDGTLELLNVLSLEGIDPRGFNIINNKLLISLCDQDKVIIYDLNNGIPTTKIQECELHSPVSIVCKDAASFVTSFL